MNNQGVQNLKDIQSLLKLIQDQVQKNEIIIKKLNQLGVDTSEITDGQQFLIEIKQQLKQPKYSAQVLKTKCEQMIDQLLNDEYKLDRTLTRFQSRRRRTNVVSTGNVLQQIDSNTIKEIEIAKNKQTINQHQSQKEVVKLTQESNQIVQQEKIQEQQLLEKKQQNNNDEINNPLDQLINLNYQVQYCLELLKNQDNTQIDDDKQDEIIMLEKKLNTITQNKVYNDENIDVYVVYRDPKCKNKKIPRVEVNY